MNLTSNPNTHWMAIFVDELAKNGLEAVCIAPGSRSTPLTLAFANQSSVKIYRHLDERSAGFFALGMAIASGKPVALVCTSGTAAANFHPAIIEAYYANVPLLVLTADRPAELRGSGANQTIDQIKMFGDHVRWSVEVPMPEENTPDVVVRHLRTLASRAYATAAGLVQGPVHLNFPFRKPLQPQAAPNGPNSQPPVTKAAFNKNEAFTLFSRGRIVPDAGQLSVVLDAVRQNPRGLIICGPNCPRGEFPAKVALLAERTGYPVLADPLSNVRHGSHVNSFILGGYHSWLPATDQALISPSLVLRFGAVPTSGTLAALLDNAAPAAHFHIREDGQWADDLHLTHGFMQTDPTLFCEALAKGLSSIEYRPDPAWSDHFIQAETETWHLLGTKVSRSPFFDGTAVNLLLSALPEDTVLFAGNSLPVRHVDTFDRPSTRRANFFGNRGASGIDGNVSTALGLAAASGQHVVALLGDVTFYHDMNGLLAIRQNAVNNITFIVINNNGGGIFHRLPVANFDPPFTDLFLTPHGLTFEHAAALYGLGYAAVDNEAGLGHQLIQAFTGAAKPRLIEIKTNSITDFKQMRAIADNVAAGLKKAVIPII